mmetsp:Transcript_26226/g.32161  ORF Transcript_26226/g.32161 Transcript_26226/m.32161 type:complete len:106 (-) Transcript_26226:443-760(-)
MLFRDLIKQDRSRSNVNPTVSSPNDNTNSVEDEYNAYPAALSDLPDREKGVSLDPSCIPIPKMLPVGMFTDKLLEPSNGSNAISYILPGDPKMIESSSSDANTAA